MRVLFAAVVLLLATTAHAAEPRKYAVLSLIGDKFLLAQTRSVADSAIDRVDRQYVAIEDPVIDRIAVQAVNEALLRADPTSGAILLQAKDSTIFDAQDKLLGEGLATSQLLGNVRDMLAGLDVTHLVLVSKFRHDAMPNLLRTVIGTTYLEGLGFFVDRNQPPTADAAPRVGYLAPFAYYRVAVIELSSGRVIKDQTVTASITIPSTRSDTGNPWEALNAQEKMRVIQDMIRRETARVLPRLLDAP